MATRDGGRKGDCREVTVLARSQGLCGCGGRQVAHSYRVGSVKCEVWVRANRREEGKGRVVHECKGKEGQGRAGQGKVRESVWV